RPRSVGRDNSGMVVYELHLRDFSANDASVHPAQRGKYGAFSQSASRGMQHLAAMARAGVTDLHLLPVYDLATVPERGCTTPQPSGAPDAEDQQALVMAGAAADCFNWGYDPFHFNAPEGSYASDANDGAVRIIEFRRMVQALHRSGLRVGMDVVYNHTTASGQKPRSVLDRIVPGYYQRLDTKGQVETSTCCDNTATEHLMMAKLMIDSAVIWARDHHIDSFRFDLMGHQPRAAMEKLQRAVNAATGRHIHLIGEGWNFGEVADGKRFVQASQQSLNGSGIASFSDRGRDAARGGGCCDNAQATLQRQGWLNGLVHDPNVHANAEPVELLRAADMLRVGLAGTLRSYRMTTHDGSVKRLDEIPYGDDAARQGAGFASQPGEVVNYVENHDNQTLFDINVLKLPQGTSREDRARVQVLGLALTAFSQGVAYFHAGVEMLRSKSGDRNSFDSGDWFNRIDWTFSDNGFGSGLPPKSDNADFWPALKPLLADTANIKPTPAEIVFTRDAFFDLLKIRASSSLFRLTSAEDVQSRLAFHNTGPGQQPAVLVGLLDGRGLPGAGFAELLYVLNAHKQAQELRLPALQGRRYRLHPVHLQPTAADKRPLQARWNPEEGR
ncbi:MAG TPA: alpha-1,6-glucosidase domain-containing protein, partial [Rubrivivax sp.]|nr:alpha-1,6-glucosidase domain-containing protein [Rubrivivax sp.]